MRLTIEGVAQLCHEINRTYCESIGDGSQLPWTAAPQWQRDSALDGVRFRLEHPHAAPSASHENWLIHKQAGGWKYGPVKDEVKREHPCIVEFDRLPAEQRVKDYLFASVVASLGANEMIEGVR